MALIENNKIKAGEKLPSEFDLQNKYQASRDTIRKALLLLSQNGYIQKSQGKSSIVLDINRFNFPVSGLTSFKEIASDIKGKVETIVHTCECIEPDEEKKKLLMLKSGTKVWYIERVLDILPMPKGRGFLDTNDTCLLKSYYISPKKVDAPTFHIFIAAFLSLSWLVLHFAQIHSRTAKFLVSGFFVPQTWQICELG